MDYYNAVICLNGHVVDSMLENNTTDKFCQDCGADNLSECKNCNSKIRGYIATQGVFYDYHAPAYCFNCGKLYPWTEQMLLKAETVINFDDSITKEEKELLYQSAKNIIASSPSTSLDASIFVKITNKASKYLKDAMYQFAVDVASETAKKVIFPE